MDEVFQLEIGPQIKKSLFSQENVQFGDLVDQYFEVESSNNYFEC